MFNSVPASPQHSGERVAQFGCAEPHLRVGSLSLHVRATRITPHGPEWPARCADTGPASGAPRSDPVRIRLPPSRSIVRSSSVRRPRGPAFQSCLSRCGLNTDRKHTPAFLRCCAVMPGDSLRLRLAHTRGLPGICPLIASGLRLLLQDLGLTPAFHTGGLLPNVTVVRQLRQS